MPSGQHVTPGTRLGGRKKKSLDLQSRKLLTGRMAADLLTVYEKLGGVKWLLQFAKDNPAEFLRQGLSRLFPAPDKHDGPDAVINQLNITDVSDFEAARRIAFALSKAMHQSGSTIEYPVPVPVPAPQTQPPAPEANPVMPPTSEEKRDQAALQQSLDDHPGTPEERGLPRPRRHGGRADLL